MHPCTISTRQAHAAKQMQLRCNRRCNSSRSPLAFHGVCRPRVEMPRSSVLRPATQQQQQGQEQEQPRPAARGDGDRQHASAMPRLPQRPTGKQASSTSTSNTTSTSSSSPPSPKGSIRRSPRRAPGALPPPPPPEQQQQHSQERTFASLLAYSGLLGTVASAVSMVCPDVDLFGNFALNPADITLGLQLLLPCCLLNLAIMAPDYSSWKVPQEPTIEAQQKMAEALLAWTANKQAAAAQSGAAKDHSSSSSSNKAATIDSPAADASTPAASSTADPASRGEGGASMQQAAIKGDAQQSGSSSSSSSSSGGRVDSSSGSSGSEAGPGMTPPWLMERPEPPLPLPLARLKDALLLAQGHYLSSSPRVALPVPMQAVVLLVNCLAAELLYRSVMLQVSGGWLTDRMLEAGAEDWIQAATAHLPVLATPHMPGQLAAVALLSGAWGVAVLRQVARMSRRPVRVLTSQGKVASGQLLQDMQRLSGRGRQGQQPQQQQEGQGTAGSTHAGTAEQRDGSSSASNSDSLTNVGPERDGPSTSDSQAPSRTAAELAAAAAAAREEGTSSAGSSDRSSSDRSSSSKQPDRRPSRSLMLPNALGALALSQVVTGARDLSQAAGLGLAFALTGNLAAPFVASVVTEGLMAVLQRRAQERSRKRSVAFAAHFANFTRVFRDVQRQQQLQQSPEQQDRAGADSSQQQQHAASVSASASDTIAQSHVTVVPGASTATSSSSSSGAEDCSGDVDALDAAVVAVVGDCHPAALHAAAAAAAASHDAGEAGASGTDTTRVQQTLNVLDQLLGEQLSERAAAAGPPGK